MKAGKYLHFCCEIETTNRDWAWIGTEEQFWNLVQINSFAAGFGLVSPSDVA